MFGSGSEIRCSNEDEIQFSLALTTITALRGRPVPLEGGATAFVTIHPSALLRIEDRADKEQAYRDLLADLKRAAKTVT